MSFERFDTEDHFDDGEVLIGGPALVEIETALFNDADIGGTDGYQTTVALVYIDLRGRHFQRHELVDIFGEDHVRAFEGKIEEREAA